MFENGFATRTESAKKCIFPVIHQLDALGDAAYGGRFYDGDMNVLHVNVLPTARTNLSAALRTDFLTGEALTDFDKHIQFHVVKYTKAQMEAVQQVVDAEIMGKLGIVSSVYDVKANKLCLGIEDDTAEAKAEIIHTLESLGYADADMIEFVKGYKVDEGGVADFSDSPVDVSAGVPDRALDAVARAGLSVQPGSWLGHGTALTSITGITSLCTGFLYNNTPGFLTCGHGATVGEKIFYQPVPSSGRYPSNLWSYSTSNLTEIGTIAAASYKSGDAYDYASILRTNSSANMSNKNFAGGTVDGDSGIPEVGEALAMCGCADGALFGTCTANSYTVTMSSGVVKTNTITMDKDTTSGSSGGCLAYLDGATNKVNLTGLLLGSNGFASHYTKYGLVKSRFNLTTVY